MWGYDADAAMLLAAIACLFTIALFVFVVDDMRYFAIFAERTTPCRCCFTPPPPIEERGLLFCCRYFSLPIYIFTPNI